MMKRLLFALALLLAASPALAQSSPGLVYGQVPTAAQWNSYFAAKQDYSSAAVTGPGAATTGNLLKWGVYPNVVDGGAPPTFVAGTGISKTGAASCVGGCTFSVTGGGVTTFSAGATGFTPSSATGGAVTLAGTLALTNGGTGATSASAARTALGSTATGDALFTAADAAAARTAAGVGTAGTLTSGVATGNLAPVATNTVLQKAVVSTTGGSHNLTTYQVMSGTTVSITPRSTTSRILVTINFAASGQFLAATNTVATFAIYETAIGTIVSGDFPLSVTTGSGGNGMQAAQTIQYVLSNSALTTRTFGLAGKTSNTSAAVTTGNVTITAEEIAN